MDCLGCVISGGVVLLALAVGLWGPPIYYRLRYGNTKEPLKGKDFDDE